MTVAAGLDVARFGQDMSAYVALDDTKIFAIDEWGKTDTMSTVGRVLKMGRDHGIAVLALDDTGIGGAVTDRLSELPDDEVPFLLVPINNGWRAREADRFHNKGAEMWWTMREAFDPKNEEPLRLPREHKLVHKLVFQVAGATHKRDTTNRIWVDKRGGRRQKPGEPERPSPDLADALALALEAWLAFWAFAGEPVRMYHRDSFLGG